MKPWISRLSIFSHHQARKVKSLNVWIVCSLNIPFSAQLDQKPHQWALDRFINNTFSAVSCFTRSSPTDFGNSIYFTNRFHVVVRLFTNRDVNHDVSGKRITTTWRFPFAFVTSCTWALRTQRNALKQRTVRS